MKNITIAQVLQLHNKMIRETDGDDGIRDPALLESALYNVLSTFDGNALYPSIEEKCANMCNPFLEIPLDVYEKHMSLDTVQQLPILNNVMKEQLQSYEVNSVMILGIAGGNGLEHIDTQKTDIVYGVDINEKYLEVCRQRYSELNGHFETVCVDLTNKDVKIPKAELVIANLFVEYIGYDVFAHHMKVMSPKFISIIIQINEQDGFISESPYIHAFDRVSEIHHQMEENKLYDTLSEIGYSKLYRKDIPLPNGKKFVQVDFMKM